MCLNPDWDALLAALRAALPQFRVFFVVPSEDRAIRWIRVCHGVGVMDLYGGYDAPGAAAPGMVRLTGGELRSLRKEHPGGAAADVQGASACARS